MNVELAKSLIEKELQDRLKLYKKEVPNNQLKILDGYIMGLTFAIKLLEKRE